MEASPGPRTPWPNRAEIAVRLFKKQLKILIKEVEGQQSLKETTASELFRKAVAAVTATRLAKLPTFMKKLDRDDKEALKKREAGFARLEASLDSLRGDVAGKQVDAHDAIRER